ncbi:hypothetical protein FACS18949_10030 [Clostridia bacterium]|nr:hypothetical protein FACS18949_10030 [Clostridia bacterium]
MIKLPDVFSNHMVLQRGKPVAVWGQASADSTVTVTFKAVTVTVSARNGEWSAQLPPSEASNTPSQLTVTDGTDTVTFEDVVVGDVWFAGGQSNMEWELQNCRDAETELALADYPDIRFCAAQRFPWKRVTPEDAKYMSAVAYFAAKTVREELKIPIGVIGCYKGGTSISCWVSRETLEKSTAGRRYITDYEARKAGKSEAECDAYFLNYPPDDWPKPASSISPFRPYGLYGEMIDKVKPYTLKGFWWYQGEEDAGGRQDDYFEMLLYLTAQWRIDFNGYDLPFFIVQLPEWTEGGEGWEVVRRAQTAVSRFISNSGCVVIRDLKGEEDNLHPTNKKPVGERLGKLTLEGYSHE